MPSELMETKVEELARLLKHDIAMRHYDLRMAGCTDEQAATLILNAVKSLLPLAQRTQHQAPADKQPLP